MTTQSSQHIIPPALQAVLDKAKTNNQRIVLMTCGLAGSGKSTLSHAITSSYPTFTRLSIDSLIYSLHGRYGIDYPPSSPSSNLYTSYQDEAEVELKKRLVEILHEGAECRNGARENGGEEGVDVLGEGRDVVLDLSFYSREFRDEYREIVRVEGKGVYEVVLVVLRGSEEGLWRRIEGRRRGWELEGSVERGGSGKGGGGEVGISISRDVLRGYLDGFGWPKGEGEIVIDVDG